MSPCLLPRFQLAMDSPGHPCPLWTQGRSPGGSQCRPRKSQAEAFSNKPRFETLEFCVARHHRVPTRRSVSRTQRAVPRRCRTWRRKRLATAMSRHESSGSLEQRCREGPTATSGPGSRLPWGFAPSALARGRGAALAAESERRDSAPRCRRGRLDCRMVAHGTGSGVPWCNG